MRRPVRRPSIAPICREDSLPERVNMVCEVVSDTRKPLRNRPLRELNALNRVLVSVDKQLEAKQSRARRDQPKLVELVAMREKVSDALGNVEMIRFPRRARVMATLSRHGVRMREQ